MSESIKQKVVALRDSKVGTFGSICLVKTISVGERMFFDLIKDKSTLIGQHPEDFSLWCVGDFDEDTGIITPACFEVCCGTKQQEA